ncbi:MAG: DUF1616 domain-containing protein [Candidatus Diapherotrites archaeon]|nr:DUF1616 domain-containing protein [Candidatus Diapherotrites archaeon]
MWQEVDLFAILPNLVVFALVAIVPGYFWTLAFYPEKNSLDRLERFAFSMVFSITFTPMLVLVENVIFRIPVNFFSVATTTLVLFIISLLIYLVRTERISAPKFVNRLFPRVKKEDSVKIVPKLF